jgi:hypothetical protein
MLRKLQIRLQQGCGLAQHLLRCVLIAACVLIDWRNIDV